MAELGKDRDMRRIKVIRGGCGVVYKDANGVSRHGLKTAASGPFECDDAQAERLVRLQVAVYTDRNTQETGEAGNAYRQSDAGVPDRDAHGQPGVGESDKEAHRQPETRKEDSAGKEADQYDSKTLETWNYNDLKKLASNLGAEPKSQKKPDLITAILKAQEENTEDERIPDIGVADPV